MINVQYHLIIAMREIVFYAAFAQINFSLAQLYDVITSSL